MKIVLLHALPLDHRMWEPQLAALADHEVHTPDLYDLGRSMDEWAGAVLEEVEGEFVAVGASMGGYCACAVARRAPERLRGLILAGSRADADPPERRPLRERWIQAIRDDGPEGLWREMAPGLFSPNADEDVVARAHELALEQSPDGLVRAVEAIRDRPDSTGAATSGIPLLVVAGAEDTLVPPAVGRELAEASPRGSAVVLDGVGHLPNLERPAEFDRVLTGFLEEL